MPEYRRIKNISDSEITEAGRVLADHTVKHLCASSALEALIFSISSQATPWEIATRNIMTLRNECYPNDSNAVNKYCKLSFLRDKERVNRVIKSAGWRFAYNCRFDESIDYFGSIPGKWWNDVLNTGEEEREEYVEAVGWLSRKTFSFWQLCLGGHNLLPLDVHIMRQLAGVGVKVNPDFYTPVGREGTRETVGKTDTLFGERDVVEIKNKQRVRKTPDKEDYLRIEQEARKLFSKDERFILPNGNLNFALADAVFWWRGANRGTLGQNTLFQKEKTTGVYVSPYVEMLNPMNYMADDDIEVN